MFIVDFSRWTFVYFLKSKTAETYTAAFEKNEGFHYRTLPEISDTTIQV